MREFVILHIHIMAYQLSWFECGANNAKVAGMIPLQVRGTFPSYHSWWLHVCCCCYITSVVSNSVRLHRRQPTRLPHPQDSPGKNTGVGCHFLLQCMKVKVKVKSVLSDSSRPHGLQPTRLLHPWDFPGKSTGVGCHCLLWVTHLGFPDNSVGKESSCNAGDLDLIPGQRRQTGEGIGYPLQYSWASLVAQLVKNQPAMQEESACNVGDLGLIPGLGRSPGEGKGYPCQYSGLENSMDCIDHRVAQSEMTEQLLLTFTTYTRFPYLHLSKIIWS